MAPVRALLRGTVPDSPQPTQFLWLDPPALPWMPSVLTQPRLPWHGGWPGRGCLISLHRGNGGSWVAFQGHITPARSARSFCPGPRSGAAGPEDRKGKGLTCRTGGWSQSPGPGETADTGAWTRITPRRERGLAAQRGKDSPLHPNYLPALPTSSSRPSLTRKHCEKATFPTHQHTQLCNSAPGDAGGGVRNHCSSGHPRRAQPTPASAQLQRRPRPPTPPTPVSLPVQPS